MRFVHAADLHLAAPFQGISVGDRRIGEALAQATYQAFHAVVDLCIDKQVDFLVLAGDIYNAADKPLVAQLDFQRQMTRLAEAGIPAFIVHGNHDPLSGWSAGLTLPESVHAFSAAAVERKEIEVDGVVVGIYGRSFANKAEFENFSLGYVRDVRDGLAVGVLHANIGGQPDHDPYAAATLDELCQRGMDYWALGHIHKRAILARDPWVVYAGSPQGLNPKETGAHGCILVEASGAGITRVDEVDLSPVKWAQAEVDLSDVTTLEGVTQAVTDACDVLRADERPVVARITLTGRTAAHASLARAGVADDLAQSLRADQKELAPWVWIDRLDNRTSASFDLGELRTGGPDFIREIIRIADDYLAGQGDVGADALVDGLLADMRGRGIPGADAHLDARDVVSAARDLLIDRLIPEGGEA